MLDQKDLEALQKMMESVMDSRFEETEKRMDSRFEQIEKRMDSRFEEVENKMESRIEEAENMLLEEMDRMQTNLSNRIDKIDFRLDAMQHEINTCRMEVDMLKLHSKRIDILENQVNELKTKTA